MIDGVNKTKYFPIKNVRGASVAQDVTMYSKSVLSDSDLIGSREKRL